MSTEPTFEQEVQWLREEIEADLCVLNSSSGTSFHRERLAENKAKWLEMTGDEWEDEA